MNVLEKILEEIEDMRDIMKSTVATDCFGKECEYNDCTVCVCERAMEIIRSHMDDAENDGWIPVGERLPEDGETVLCTDGEDIFLVEYEASLDVGFGDMDWITAWQPLPEAYRPEEDKP